jgi:hypothetical protein
VVSLPDSAASIEQLVNQPHIGLPESFIWQEADSAFVEGVKVPEMKQHHFNGGERLHSEALNHALKLKDATRQQNHQ